MWTRGILLLSLLGAGVMGGGALTPRRVNQLRLYIELDGTLRAPLVLRDAQDGFAGQTGEIWTIERGGHFSIARFVNENINAPRWQRDLTLVERRDLANLLSAHHLLSLPAALGGDPKVNAHSLTLSFGKLKSEMKLGAGEDPTQAKAPPEGESQAGPWRDFAAIVRALEALAKDRDASESPVHT